MANVMNLAIQITAIDMLSSVVSRVKQSVLSLGAASGKVKQDFDVMTRSITSGLKAIAVGSYALHKALPGVRAAGDLQEAMIDVKLNLLESGKSAQALNSELAQVRSTAIDISKVAPFGAQEVVGIQNTFLKAGLAMKDVTAKGGAAWAATALATITKESPATIADAMVTMSTPFNLKGEQFGEMADWIQRVDMASVSSSMELSEGMKYVSGTAAIMKVSYKDTLQALGVIAQSGLRGSMGGTSLNDFLIRLNGTSRETRRIMKALNSYLATKGGGKVEFFDNAGKLKALPVIINDLRNAMKQLNDHQKMFVMQKVFDIQGARAAMALIKEGEGDWESIGESIKKAVSLQDKMGERLTGFNANLKALAGTAKTTLATLFDPVLAPLTKMLSMLNDVAFEIGEIGEKNKGLSAVVSGGALAIGAGAGAYGLYALARGGIAGGKVLKGMGGVKGLLKGFGGKAAGIAEGKAVEAATGVKPVFVTNWPANFGAGMASAKIPDVIKDKAGGLLTKTLPKLGGTVAAAGLGTTAVLAVATLAASYAIGTGLNMIVGGVTSMLSKGQYSGSGWLGQVAYDMNNPEDKTKDDRFNELLRQMVTARNAGDTSKMQEIKNEIKMEIRIDKEGNVLSNTDSMNTHLDINRGTFW